MTATTANGGAPQVVALVGNPRPHSRTHGVARALAGAIARAAGAPHIEEVDLAALGPRVLEPAAHAVTEAVARVVAADVLVVASPTYKATYTGLLKAFLDRVPSGGLAGVAAVPVLLGGVPDHRLAVDVHLTPLLLELGATVPARGLFVHEDALDGFGEAAIAWAAAHTPRLVPA
jgi:FMN reductase